MKQQPIRLGIYKVICLAVKHHSHSMTAQITIMQSLQYYEHLSEPMAECLTVLAKEFDHSQLGDEILREIAGKSFNAQDSKGPRAFSRFLVRFSELLPRAILKQISLLIRHLDSEVSSFRFTSFFAENLILHQSYPMRMAMVEVVGSLIRELATASDLEQASNSTSYTSKQIDGLYDLLL